VPYFGKIVLAQLVPSTVATSVTESVSAPLPAETEEQRAEALVGKRGQAVTMLRPAGRAELDGEPLDVVTEGDFIAPGTPIEVLAVRGNRVVVRRAT
jgi:membrane-bound ClpP family serine protease